MPSSHLILCCPLLLPPSIFLSIRVFSNESVLCIRWPKYWSFSFNISPSNVYSGLISFRMDWLDLLAVQGTLKSLLQHHSSKAFVLWCSAAKVWKETTTYSGLLETCSPVSSSAQARLWVWLPICRKYRKWATAELHYGKQEVWVLQQINCEGKKGMEVGESHKLKRFSLNKQDQTVLTRDACSHVMVPSGDAAQVMGGMGRSFHQVADSMYALPCPR